MSRVRISSPAPAFLIINDAFSTQDKQKSTIRTVAHVAQSAERFLGKEEVHRFESDHGLQDVGKDMRNKDKSNKDESKKGA